MSTSRTSQRHRDKGRAPKVWLGIPADGGEPAHGRTSIPWITCDGVSTWAEARSVHACGASSRLWCDR